jgi:hypothetical protein
VVHLMAILVIEDVATTRMVVEEVINVHSFDIFRTAYIVCVLCNSKGYTNTVLFKI